AAGAADADAATKKKHHRKAKAPAVATIPVQAALARKPGASADEKMSQRDKDMMEVRSICTNC
ncbi:hypothetical protein WDZ92_53785, partial [Nostoc sp. NIES-2111]